jgi:hypothetical protein
MTYTVKIEDREFASPIFSNYRTEPIYFSWSAFGGPKILHLRLTGSPRSLLTSLRLLRSPVTVYADNTNPVWWGYVREITLYFGQLKLLVTLDQLFNRVKVQYSFLSPDNHLADQSETVWVEDLGSQTLFGTKEIILHRSKIDDDFAENLADTFLDGHAWPETEFSQSHLEDPTAHAVVKCSGWFDTLEWKYYENLKNFYANYGPGPGTFEFDQATTSQHPTQRFTANANGDLHYAYFQLRKIGSPTSNLYASLRDVSGAEISVSNAVLGSTLSANNYTWVKFTFPTPYSLVSGTTYHIGVRSNSISASNYYGIKTDENQGFIGGYARYYNGASWVNIPSVTAPGRSCDLVFRAICMTDTGAQLQAIATAGDQFFTKIVAPTSGVFISPYRANGYSCLREIQDLMNLGTGSRLILARVNHLRQLEFYEQPDPKTPTVYLDDQCVFYTSLGQSLKPYNSPVGQFAAYKGSTDLMQPFDKPNTPPSFIGQVEYWPETGGVKIHVTPQDRR